MGVDAAAVALRPVVASAERKALIVATGGATGSFALAWLLIKRVRTGTHPLADAHLTR
jgi:hypothetical protein